MNCSMDKNKFMIRRTPSNEAVQVVVRCRPMNAKENANDYKKVVEVFPSRGVIEITNPRDDGKERKKSFTFDAVYNADSTQEELYNETVHPLVSSILDGFNGTIFAYGQTGTGKTYTMEGSKTEPSQKGIILRSFDQIFNYISRSKNMQYLVRTSYLEIYQEEIRDLLNKNRRKTYELREAAGVGVYVKDLSSFVCKSAKEIEHVMYVGNQNRSIGATNMNDHSSRSHAIFMITIEMSDTESFKKIIRVGKLNLIDLAGSERQSKTGATGERLKEASKINLSLSALGNVISALVDGKNPHIPYRDSKLTRILQDSLGGNSKTIMVANIGPASYNYDETLTTLRYANRAKNIKNKPRVNEDPKDALLREYQMEIARLKGLLAERARQREMLLATQVKEKQDAYTEGDIPGSYDKEMPPTEDKVRLMKELEEKKELLAKEKYASEKLELKIAAMESKLLCGGKNIIDHTNEQQRALEQRNQEIAERKKREVEIRQKLELQEESALEIRDTYSTLQQEVDYKTKKLKKMFSRLQSIKQEIHDVTEEFNADRRELEAAHNDLLKDLKVRYLIIDNFIPSDEKTKVLLRARYDESDGSWYLLPFVPDNIVMVKRPVSSDSERRPVSDYGRVAIRVGRSHRYQKEKFEDSIMPVGKLFKHASYNTTAFSKTSRSHSQVTSYSRFSPRVQELLSRRTRRLMSRQPADNISLSMLQTIAGVDESLIVRGTDISYINCCERTFEEQRRYYTINPVPASCPVSLDSSEVLRSNYPVDSTSLSIWHSSQGQEDEILFNSFQFLTGICCIIYLFRIAYILQIVVIAVISLLNS